MSLRIFLLAAVIGVICGCVSGDNGNDDTAASADRRSATAQTAPATRPSTQMTTLTGTLRGGMMAIGGETTGWTLVGDGAVGGVELDVSKVRDAAKRLDGKRVSVSGRMVDRQYVERGRVRMMLVEKIQPAK